MMTRKDDYLPPLRTHSDFIQIQQNDIHKAFDYFPLFLSVRIRSIHYQLFAAFQFDALKSYSDQVIDLWNNTFNSLYFDGSIVFKNCIPKFSVSENSSSWKKRAVFIHLNPAIDSNYILFWKLKYNTEVPSIRLTLQNVLKYTPIFTRVTDEIQFAQNAKRASGIHFFDGTLAITTNRVRFYQRSKESQFYNFTLSINIKKIDKVNERPFLHRNLGIEIERKNQILYIFAFDTTAIRKLFCQTLQTKGINIVTSFDSKNLESLTKNWVEGNLSSFEYLLSLNYLGGRSWSDSTVYPIFPWIFSDYSSSKLDLNSSTSFRNLKYPIFAQTEQQRQACQECYELSKLMSDEPHCAPTFVSNVGSTLYFLVRLEPFTTEVINFQSGSLDAADRTFQSLKISWDVMTSAATSANSLEALPEFYFSPDIFLNANEIAFPISPIHNKIIGNVEIPPWSRDVREFVFKSRFILEHKSVSSLLHEWIDLIFGVRLHGASAIARHNVFQSTVFAINEKYFEEDRILEKAVLGLIHNCGQAPRELFKKSHPQRTVFHQPVNMKLFFKQTIIIKELERLQYNFSLSPDRWIVNPSNTSSIKSFSLKDGYVQFLKNNSIFPGITFLDNLRITCFDVSGDFLIAGHIIPLVTIWKIGENLISKASICCHLSLISIIHIAPKCWDVFLVGHDDGAISIISLTQRKYIRVISNIVSNPIQKLYMAEVSGDIYASQNDVSNFVISMWSVNGLYVNSMTFNGTVLDIVTTNFDNGVQPNYLFVLSDEGIIYQFAAESLLAIQEFRVLSPNPVALILQSDKKKTELLVTHTNFSASIFKLN